MSLQNLIIYKFASLYHILNEIGLDLNFKINCAESKNSLNNIIKNLKILDLTGAGDLFASGFLHGYVNKLSIKESLDKGTEMSAKIIQQIGARL